MNIIGREVCHFERAGPIVAVVSLEMTSMVSKAAQPLTTINI